MSYILSCNRKFELGDIVKNSYWGAYRIVEREMNLPVDFEKDFIFTYKLEKLSFWQLMKFKIWKLIKR